VPPSRRNDRAVCHNHVIEPLGRFDICRALPDAKSAASVRQLEACKLRVSLQGGFEQVRAHAVMPLSHHLSRRLDHIEDSQRSRLIISSFRPAFVQHRNSPHHAEKCVPARAACLCSRAPTGAGSSRILRPGFPFPVRPRLGQQLLPAATAALELDVKRGPEVGASSFSPGTAVMRHDDVLKGHDSSGTRRRNAGGALTVIIFSQWGDGCSVLHRPTAAAPHHVSRDLPREDLERQYDVIGAIAITKPQRGLHDLSV